MTGWLSIGLIVLGLVGVACIVLIFDIARGDVFTGARHTMTRARRLLIISTDDETQQAAEEWVSAQRIERPDLQCFMLNQPDGQELFEAIAEAIDREKIDALVMARHGDPHLLTGTYGRLKEELRLPVDAIPVGKATTA